MRRRAASGGRWRVIEDDGCAVGLEEIDIDELAHARRGSRGGHDDLVTLTLRQSDGHRRRRRVDQHSRRYRQSALGKISGAAGIMARFHDGLRWGAFVEADHGPPGQAARHWRSSTYTCGRRTRRRPWGCTTCPSPGLRWFSAKRRRTLVSRRKTIMVGQLDHRRNRSSVQQRSLRPGSSRPSGDGDFFVAGRHHDRRCPRLLVQGGYGARRRRLDALGR